MKCVVCEAELGESDTCSCHPDHCSACCDCPEDCSCGCRANKEESKEGEE